MIVLYIFQLHLLTVYEKAKYRFRQRLLGEESYKILLLPSLKFFGYLVAIQLVRSAIHRVGADKSKCW